MCSQTCPRHAAGTQATHNLTTDLTADQAMSSVRSERVHRLGYPKNVISSFWKLEGSQCLKSDARAHTCACTCARTRAHTHTHTHTHTPQTHTKDGLLDGNDGLWEHVGRRHALAEERQQPRAHCAGKE